jgi:hypothetical protein
MRVKIFPRTLFVLWFAFGFAFPALNAAENKQAVATAAPDSSGSLQVPVLGFVAQSAPLPLRPVDSPAQAALQVRPVMGKLGAAVLGNPISLPRDLTRIAVSPTQTYLLGERGESQELAVLSLAAAGAGPEVAISGTFPRSQLMEFSLSGSAAALYSASRGHAQVITGLPDAPQITQQFDLSSLPAPLTALAVSDDGSTLLVGASDGQTGAVYLVSATNGIRSLVTAGVPAAIRFLSSDSAVVADSRASQILLLSTISGVVTSRVLAGAADGVNGPTQVEVCSANQAAVVSNGGSKLLLSIDLSTGKLTFVSMSYPVTGLHAVTGSPMVFISSESSAFWSLGLNASGPSLTFIPRAKLAPGVPR